MRKTRTSRATKKRPETPYEGEHGLARLMKLDQHLIHRHRRGVMDYDGLGLLELVDEHAKLHDQIAPVHVDYHAITDLES